jgi:hypothetical protein
MRTRACLAAVGLSVLALAVLWRTLPVQAADGVVGSGAPGSCTSAELAEEAAAGGAITFDCGPGPLTIALTETISPGPNTTLDGGSLGQITLDATGSKRLFYIAPGQQVTLTRLTLINGFINGPGGAIANQGGRLVLDRVRLENNTVPSPWGAGAIYNYAGGHLIVQASNFIENESVGGGAIYNNVGSHVTIVNSQFTQNASFGLYGGAISNLGWLTVTGGLFTGNFVSYTADAGYPIGGGAIANFAGSQAMLNGVTFSDNEARPAFPADLVGGALLNAGTARLTGAQVLANRAFRGGGLHNTGTLLLTDTVVALNSAYLGGGLFNEDGILTVSGGQLAGNTATTHGGALYNGWIEEVTPASFSGTHISGNSAQQNGGGLYVYKGRVDLMESLLEGNQAGESGGGAYVYLAALHVISSTLQLNEAAMNGGGIQNYGLVTLSGVTVADNTAGVNGGGLYHQGSRLALTNSTFSGNAASQAGGGLYSYGDASLRHVTLADNRAVMGGAIASEAGYTPVLTNTIVANSPQGGNCFGEALTAKYSLDSDGTCDLTGAGNKVSVDALLTALGDYGGPTHVHMLLPGSPAFNGVMGSDALGVDQRGEMRPVGAYDIGAVERQTDDTSLAPHVWLPALLR